MPLMPITFASPLQAESLSPLIISAQQTLICFILEGGGQRLPAPSGPSVSGQVIAGRYDRKHKIFLHLREFQFKMQSKEAQGKCLVY